MRPLTRRDFILGAGAAAAAGFAGHVLAAGGPTVASAPRRVPAAAARAGGTLVLVTLSGGNDGLNTVIPVADPAYHAARPTLGLRPDEVLGLADGMGLHPALKGLKSLWDAGRLAIVRGVGYPGPSLSHFRSTAVWQSADPRAAEATGWIGRWLDGAGSDPLAAVSIGVTVPPAMRGVRGAGAAVPGATITLPGTPAEQAAYSALGAPGPDRTGLAGASAAAFVDLLGVRGELQRLVPTVPAAPGGAAGTATGTLAGRMAIVAALIRAGAPTRVYEVGLNGFDTHAGQKATHERLLAELDGAVADFLASLADSGHGDGVVVMTSSEFGRRVAENASGGTDHGTAAPLLIAGARIRGGAFYGDQPSLTALDDGNLRFTVDFRSVYATVLDRVVGVDPASVLGARFPILPVL